MPALVETWVRTAANQVAVCQCGSGPEHSCSGEFQCNRQAHEQHLNGEGARQNGGQPIRYRDASSDEHSIDHEVDADHEPLQAYKAAPTPGSKLATSSADPPTLFGIEFAAAQEGHGKYPDGTAIGDVASPTRRSGTRRSLGS